MFWHLNIHSVGVEDRTFNTQKNDAGNMRAQAKFNLIYIVSQKSKIYPTWYIVRRNDLLLHLTKVYLIDFSDTLYIRMKEESKVVLLRFRRLPQ